MKYLITATITLAAILAGSAAFAQESQPQTTSDQTTAAKPIRVGVYDSRAIAMAFAASDMFNEEMQGTRKEYETAKADGNETRVKEIDESMQAMQRKFHQQGFGTASVDDILARIKGELPGIAEAAGVDIIVSKWAINYQSSDANLTDVTLQVVAPFNPSERTLQIINDLKNKQPLSAKDLEQMSDH